MPLPFANRRLPSPVTQSQPDRRPLFPALFPALHPALSPARLLAAGGLALGAATTSLAAPAKNVVSVEGQVSDYQYEEPGVMRLTGSKVGIAGRVTTLEETGAFVRAEGRLAGGKVDYTSNASGSTTGEPDWLSELRGTGGYEWTAAGAEWALHAGLGYRYLVNDSSNKISTTGHYGYKRASTYLYLPVGLGVRKPLGETQAVSVELEFDQLLLGTQRSYIEPTISNRQEKGHGFRGAIDYHFSRSWSLGLFANAWRIDESTVATCDWNGDGIAAEGCIEPKNNTREFGLRLRFTR